MRNGQTIIILILCVLAGWRLAEWVRRHAARLRLVSIPNHRSSHAAPTPHGGGLGIVIGGSLTGLWLAWRDGALDMAAVMVLSVVIAAVGLIDDIRHLPARLRFVVQVVVCGSSLLILGYLTPPVAPLVMTVGNGIAPEWWTLAALLLLSGVWWINLYNFMDGIDGIAGTQAVAMLVSAMTLAAIQQSEVVGFATWLWMMAIAAAAVGFLKLNWPPARIFMGDVGSTYLAYMIFAFTLVTVREGWLSFTAWSILGAVFITDATLTLLKRVFTGERWFEAHRSHAYQRLARRFQAHRPVTLLVGAINLLWLTPLAWLSLYRPEWAWGVTAAAYAPLIIGVLLLGAGRRDHV